jgi:protein SCO1
VRNGRRALAAAAAAGLLAGCGGKAWNSHRPGAYRGTELKPAMPEPDFTLTATDGRPYHFKAESQGYVTLLYFGYTHCPDVCPVQMANLASVLRRLPIEVAGSVKVVFVTVDPARDTPKVLRAWLDNFDSHFVGLHGPLTLVNQIQDELHMPRTAVEPLPKGGYAVGHGAAVIAMVGDSARVLYAFGTRQADWMHDLPKLVATIPPARQAD